MTRHALRGLALFGLLAAVTSTAYAQNFDAVNVRDRKDNSVKKVTGTYTVSAAGFQVLGADKKVVATVNPDDVVSVAIGDLPNVDRSDINKASTKENDKKYAEAQAVYKEATKPGLPERSARYLRYKTAYCYNRVVDDIDYDKGWAAKAKDVVQEWKAFLTDYKFGWEVWSATRAYSRVQIELGQYSEAATVWQKLAGNKEIPADARLEAQIQEIDLYIRGKAASSAVGPAGELLKTANGPQKERLAIYEIAAKAAGDNKAQEGIDAIKKEMEKTKDQSVHATGFAMMGELHLLAGKPRDAMWAFLWVETVLNQDRDEAFKAVAKLASLFESGPLADEDQHRKYRDKLKRLRATF